MKILVIGSGGREHALVWKIAKSSQVKKIFCAPGNPGTNSIAENINFSPDDIPGLLKFAMKEKIDLTVVGPEVPLVMGIVDEFEKKGLKIFGPNKNAAFLEGSKVFAKQFMERHQIPTGAFQVAENSDQALSILKSDQFSFPLVLKADGLAAGKGAVICKDQGQAKKIINDIMVKKKYGDAGNLLLIEEFLRGEEVSFISIVDGIHAIPLVTTMDHKAVYEGDKGPNTGGMGAISPSPFTDKELFEQVMNTIVFPTVTRLLEEERKFKGVLYVGLMLTDEGPKVLEYNCRFGDPETQPQMLRLESDLVDLLMASVNENLEGLNVIWSEFSSGCVVLTSGGYPGKYKKGVVIEGLKEAEQQDDITIFHAGTKFENKKLLTNGGRVLNVCSIDKELSSTMTKIYNAIPSISFENMYYRKDIGVEKED